MPSNKHPQKCPRCGYGRTGRGGGFRYCPDCGWSNKPKPEPKPKPKINRGHVKDFGVIHMGADIHTNTAAEARGRW